MTDLHFYLIIRYTRHSGPVTIQFTSMAARSEFADRTEHFLYSHQYMDSLLDITALTYPPRHDGDEPEHQGVQHHDKGRTVGTE